MFVLFLSNLLMAFAGWLLFWRDLLYSARIYAFIGYRKFQKWKEGERETNERNKDIELKFSRIFQELASPVTKNVVKAGTGNRRTK